MTHLAELVAEAVVQLFLGMSPERPVWLRRFVQACWIALAAAVVVAWTYGLVALLRAL